MAGKKNVEKFFVNCEREEEKVSVESEWELKMKNIIDNFRIWTSDFLWALKMSKIINFESRTIGL